MLDTDALNLATRRLDLNQNAIRGLMKRTDERLAAASRMHSVLVEICKRLVHSGALVLAFSLVFGQHELSARTISSLRAEFSWTVPPRLVVNESTGLIQSLDEADIEPADGWPVQFNACGSSSSAISFRWAIAGGEVIIKASCDGFEYLFPSEGLYQVTLTVADAAGASAQTTQDVTVQDWLIVGLGDSYASGEGVPDAPLGTQMSIQLADAGKALMNAQKELGVRKSELETRIANLAPLKKKYDASLKTRNTIASKAQDFGTKYNNFKELCLPPPVRPRKITDCLAATKKKNDAQTALKNAVVNIDWKFNIGDLDGLRGVLQSLLNNAKTPYDTAIKARVTAQKLKGEAKEALTRAVSDRMTLKQRIAATWQDRRCHRSHASGQAQAALQIEDDDPHTSVTFIHLACSGATIKEGLLEGYKGVQPTSEELRDEPLLDPQVDEFRSKVGEREVDAVLISIGGNDVYFSDLITRCMTSERCYKHPFVIEKAIQTLLFSECIQQLFSGVDCMEYFEVQLDPRLSAEEMFQNGKHTLSGGYSALNDALGKDSRRVYISEYPNATCNENGDHCGLKKGFLGISQPEWEWAEGMTEELNAAIKQAADDHNWTFVTGVFDGFKEHGFCAKDSWLVRLGESIRTQGNPDGTMHPNQQGYGNYKDAIVASLKKDFYPGGDVSSPRPPR